MRCPVGQKKPKPEIWPFCSIDCLRLKDQTETKDPALHRRLATYTERDLGGGGPGGMTLTNIPDSLAYYLLGGQDEAAYQQGINWGLSTNSPAKEYILDILKHPEAYVGSSGVQGLEMLLLNLLLFRASMLEIECSATKVLREIYYGMFGVSAGAAGPASKFSSLSVKDKSVIRFYRAFVNRVFELESDQ